MNIRLGALLIVISIAGQRGVWSQTLTNGDALKERMRREDYYLRIDRKIDRDLKATRIKVVPIDPETFPLRFIALSDGREIDFSDGAPSQLLFLVNESRKDAPEKFEIVPAAIQRQPAVVSDSALLGRTQGGERAFSTVLHLKDIARLSGAEQLKILEYIVDNIAMSRDVLEVPIQGNASQQIFPNHRDFWSYSKANSHFLVPLLERKEAAGWCCRVKSRAAPSRWLSARTARASSGLRQRRPIVSVAQLFFSGGAAHRLRGMQ